MTAVGANRRQFLQSAATAAAATAFPAPPFAQGAAPRAIVIGGGFGGASCARALRKVDPKISITLIEANDIYFSMPHSSAAMAGLIEIRQQQFRYDRLRADGIRVIIGEMVGVDPVKRTVSLASGADPVGYDRLVISPGIEFRAGAIEGYDARAMATMPPAYNNGAEVSQLRYQLEAMENGGLVVITVPVNPARCPPSPYERASLIAYYLKNRKPRSKLIVLDSKDSFTMQKLFEMAWQEFYPGLIEWVGLSSGGALSSVDVTSLTLSTDFHKFKAAVANIIPPQRAGRAAAIAGVADRTGWCPVDPVTFESRLQKNIHVIGDAAIAGAMPRSASAAHSQAAICAAAISTLLAGNLPQVPTLISSCYSLIAPDYAISQKGRYRPVEDQYTEINGGPVISPAGAPHTLRHREAEEADAWYRRITGEVFG
jgi:sulfide dehydrogenase [flavocytochrome c] flavoprotein subunit